MTLKMTREKKLFLDVKLKEKILKTMQKNFFLKIRNFGLLRLTAKY